MKIAEVSGEFTQEVTGSCFGRDARLRSQSQFMAVRQKGRTVAGKYCVINLLNPSPDKSCRAGFSISRRFSKLAVERNRARRLFREVYRLIRPFHPETWIVFIPRKHILMARMEEVHQDVNNCISRLYSTSYKE